MRYAVVLGGKVINWIEWDGREPYSPGVGKQLLTAVEAKGLPEALPVSAPFDDLLEKRVAALEAKVVKP